MSAGPDLGTPPELAWLPVERLEVDPAYQRTLDRPGSRKLIAKIAADFRWASFQAILATPQGDGDARRWLIIDGQHRCAAARERGIAQVPAVVIAEASQAEQAAAFVGANHARAPVSAQVLFHARLLAGDERCATVKRIADAAGIRLLRYPQAVRTTPPGASAAIPAMLRAVAIYGEANAAAAIAAVSGAFGSVAGGLRGPFFLAAARFLAEGGAMADLPRALDAVGLERALAAVIGHGGQSGSPALVALWRAAARRSAAATEVGGRDSRERPAPSDRIGTAAQARRQRGRAGLAPPPAVSAETRQQPPGRAPPVLGWDAGIVIGPARPAPVRRYTNGAPTPFQDDLAALADHGSPGRPTLPPSAQARQSSLA